MAATPLKIPVPIPDIEDLKVRDQVQRDFAEIAAFLGPLGTPTPTGGISRDRVTGAFTIANSLTINPDLQVTNRIMAAGNSGLLVTADPTALQCAGTLSGLRMVDRDNTSAEWVLYPTASKLRFFDGTTDMVTIDRSTGLTTWTQGALSNNLGRIGPSVNFGNAFFEFANASVSSGTYYSVLAANDGTTYINCTNTSLGIHLRVNNVDKVYMLANASFHGVGLGNNGTFAEATNQNSLVGGGGSPNYLIEAGTLVINFVGGNANMTFRNTYTTVYSIVVSEAGGNGDTVIGTQVPAGGGGTGIYAIHAGAVMNGLVRVNYFLLAS